MKLIVFPLSILILLSLLSMTGIGDVTLGDPSVSLDVVSAKYYDSAGVAKVYVSNLTCVTGDPYFKLHNVGGYAEFSNTTEGWFGVVVGYPLYYDNGASYRVKYEDLGKTLQGSLGGIDIGSSIGFLALVIGVMALAAIVGLRVLGSGISEESVSAILKGGAFLAIWAVFSVLALDLITVAGDLFLPIVYFVLTAVYTLGIINQIGHPGDD